MQINYQAPEEEKDVLSKYTINLTQKAREGKLDPVIGRDEEIRRVIQILSRRTKNNPALLGDPGVGKTAIVEGLSQRMVNGDVPDTLKNKQLLTLDLTGILAGAAFRGEFEQRLKKILEEVEKGQGKYVLFIDELHTLVEMVEPKEPLMPVIFSNLHSRAAVCTRSEQRLSVNIANTWKRIRRSNVVFSRCISKNRQPKTRLPYCAGLRKNTKSITG
jgi:DNA replication protein DnaC